MTKSRQDNEIKQKEQEKITLKMINECLKCAEKGFPHCRCAPPPPSGKKAGDKGNKSENTKEASGGSGESDDKQSQKSNQTSKIEKGNWTETGDRLSYQMPGILAIEINYSENSMAIKALGYNNDLKDFNAIFNAFNINNDLELREGKDFSRTENSIDQSLTIRFKDPAILTKFIDYLKENIPSQNNQLQNDLKIAFKSLPQLKPGGHYAIDDSAENENSKKLSTSRLPSPFDPPVPRPKNWIGDDE